MRLILSLIALVVSSGALAQSAPLILKNGQIKQSDASDTLAIGTSGAITGKLVDIYQTTTTGADYSSVYVNRSTSHRGGTPGVVDGALLIQDYVNSGVTNYEWALTSVLNNSATGGQNVAIYGQASRQTTSTGPTWAGVFEVREKTPIANPRSGTVGIEVDVGANGTDDFRDRIGLDIVANRYNLSGPATVTGYGIRLNTTDGVNSKFSTGVGILANADVGFDTSLATINTAAFRMAQGQMLSFDASEINTLTGDKTGLAYKASGMQKIRLNNNGTVQLLVLTISALPSCTSQGEGTLASVSDSTSATFNAPIVGGGTSHVMAYCNGSSWTVH